MFVPPNRGPACACGPVDTSAIRYRTHGTFVPRGRVALSRVDTPDRWNARRLEPDATGRAREPGRVTWCAAARIVVEVDPAVLLRPPRLAEPPRPRRERRLSVARRGRRAALVEAE